jgi:hypothetical protein
MRGRHGVHTRNDRNSAKHNTNCPSYVDRLTHAAFASVCTVLGLRAADAH